MKNLAGSLPASASAKPADSAASVGAKPLRLGLLTALVIGSMIGSGVFSLPQNMASGAGAAAVLIGWLIAGAGMLMLAFVYQTLTTRKPELDNGIYAYARASAGDFVGFNSAWGYWVSAWIGNVGYLVIVFGTLGYFFPVFGDGNTRAAVLGASITLWIMHAVILRGVRGAAVLNAITTVAKIIPLLLFIVLAAAAFKGHVIAQDFWGNVKLGSVFTQVKSTMLITVWVFIGIEGASVFSARAQRREDIGRATLLGFAVVLVLLMAVSLLSLGIVPQGELAAMKNPSMAGVLDRAVGAWGAVLISLGLLVSVGGALLAWTLLAAETLFTPADGGVMPKFLARENSHGVPANALWVTNGLVQLFLIITLVSSATYQALISLATSMILVPYLFSAVYATRIAMRGEGYAPTDNTRLRDLLIGAAATVYCCWLLYAAGPKYLLLSALLYAPGVLLYGWAKRERGARLFKPFEVVILAALLVLAAVAAWLLSTGALGL
ncbi:arginine-ornithine antiporter [Paraburkholderia terricola]|uniref:Arginine-ornithine antiporter n=1 Tax=Paraburkholderia terricola TaxID=169427 RepID=A0A1M6Z632_9BURK|nr:MULTISPECIES: arginine-ornithine antiporter [Paraburkholderia]ORC49521.1 arginine-ornithine antiporter [Burkholderia sp. A27]MDR6412631.1 arginine:ornithine antiporter/lysine permease [Paraburkholderia terricola]MDR6485051.1 arginine:ornithine antiporter/lysine permease [Paraburkholderia terricola]SDP45299.1 arginine:ornithine antiporter, APA family [Paraburkholderia sediminicola]SHL25759.1 arginine:ornithine antiporter, APA family [Paraburkholderia terricola]